MKDPKREYLDYWYSLSGNLGCTKSFGLKVWMEQQKKIDELEKRIDNAMHDIGQAKDGHYGYSSEGGDIDTFAIHVEKSLNGVR